MEIEKAKTVLQEARRQVGAGVWTFVDTSWAAAQCAGCGEWVEVDLTEEGLRPVNKNCKKELGSCLRTQIEIAVKNVYHHRS